MTSEEFDDLQGPGEDDADLLDEDGDTPTDDCPRCGAEIYADADRCPNCGEYVIPGTPPEGNTGCLLFALAVLVLATGALASSAV